MRIAHIIADLDQGGAEGVLERLVRNRAVPHPHFVISLMDGGVHGRRLQDAGIPVHSLKLPRGRVTLRGMVALYKLLRRIRPHIVQTWMYHADLVGGVTARLAGCRSVVWGIRHGDIEHLKWSTLFIARLNALLSRIVPRAIVCCSERAMEVHREAGYTAEEVIIIPNGVDTRAFRPCLVGRRAIREEFGVSEEEILLGCVGRWNPAKDHRNLIAALSNIPCRDLAMRCVLVGNDMMATNGELGELLTRYGCWGQVILAGRRDDMPELMNAFDFLVLPSANEAFPNVVAEAMACGTPCVVTDVGDSRSIVADTGWVVPPRDPVALAQAIGFAARAIGKEGKGRIGALCRDRILRCFSLDGMVAAYEAVWERAASKN